MRNYLKVLLHNNKIKLYLSGANNHAPSQLTPAVARRQPLWPGQGD